MRKKFVPFNYHSKDEDRDLSIAMKETLDFANSHLPLPEGYIYEIWTNLSFRKMQDWLIQRGFPVEETAYLTVKNPKGDDGSIKPDSGVLVAVKKDNGGNIENWYPLLAAESKHQESTVGNAVERFFKNSNGFKSLFEAEDIFPYLLFSQGEGFTSSFICNKIRIGVGSEINRDVDIYKRDVKVRGKILKRANSNAFVRPRKWEVTEMKGRLVSALIQSHGYFFPAEAKSLAKKID